MQDDKNYAPIADFTVLPNTGNTSTVFKFYATQCTDDIDPPSSLRVRWDWDNDGIWDTEYSTDRSNEHQYDTGGEYTIVLQVTDKEGLTDNKTRSIIVTSPD